jgi:hypothetical protein
MQNDMNQIDWRTFPVLESVFQSGRLPEFLARCEQTCRQLDELAKSPDVRLAERARSAMTAYGHALQLISNLASTASQPADGPAR